MRLTDDRKELVARWLPFALSRVRRLARAAGMPVGRLLDDLHGVSVDALMSAAQTFDPAKGSYGTHLGWACRMCLLRFQRARARGRAGRLPCAPGDRGEVALADPKAPSPPDVLAARDEAAAGLRAVGAKLPPRLSRALWLHHADGLTQAEVGAALGVTQQRAGQLIEQGLALAAGRSWTPDRDRQLKALSRRGLTSWQIAERLGVTKSAVQTRRHHLGCPAARGRRPAATRQ